MGSSIALAIILSFVGLLVFILISKNDLGVTTLKKDSKSHSTLLGTIATGLPGTTILNSTKKAVSDPSKSNP